MDKLKFINDEMTAIAVPYEFGEWSSEVVYPYFVGEITNDAPTTEDGLEESTMILNGFHRGDYIDLLAIDQQIKKHFHPAYGKRASTESGAIAAFYAGSFYVPSNEAGLKRIQINLKIKEWKGAI